MGLPDGPSKYQGVYSAWFSKVKGDGAKVKWLQSSCRRYFTLDFESQIIFYSHSASDKRISLPIAFRDIQAAFMLEDEVHANADVEEHLAYSAIGMKLSRPQTMGGRATPFVLQTRDKRIQLVADSECVARSWVDLLNTACGLGDATGRQDVKVPARVESPTENRWITDSPTELCSNMSTATGSRSATEGSECTESPTASLHVEVGHSTGICSTAAPGSAAEVAVEEALPDGWESAISDEYDRTYYFNRATAERSWEWPRDKNGWKASPTAPSAALTAAMPGIAPSPAASRAAWQATMNAKLSQATTEAAEAGYLARDCLRRFEPPAATQAATEAAEATTEAATEAAEAPRRATWQEAAEAAKAEAAEAVKPPSSGQLSPEDFGFDDALLEDFQREGASTRESSPDSVTISPRLRTGPPNITLEQLASNFSAENDKVGLLDGDEDDDDSDFEIACEVRDRRVELDMELMKAQQRKAKQQFAPAAPLATSAANSSEQTIEDENAARIAADLRLLRTQSAGGASAATASAPPLRPRVEATDAIPDEDEARRKAARKAAKAAAKLAASQEATGMADPAVGAAEQIEADEDKARRKAARKAAKEAAKLAASQDGGADLSGGAAGERKQEPIDADEDKARRKAARRAAKEAGLSSLIAELEGGAPEQIEADEAKAQRRAARKTAKEAAKLLAAEEGTRQPEGV